MKLVPIDPLTTKLLPAALVASVALALTACGGGGGSSTTANNGTVTAASGVVIDGYIQGAKVCADTNDNAVCDEGEPSVTTGADGSYSGLEVGSATTILVETTTESKDADDNGATLGDAGREPFTLRAPATAVEGQEKFVVTPLTTMVTLAMQEDPNLTPKTAGDALVKQLGLGDPAAVNFFADYKAGNNAFMGQMAQGIADSLGEAEALHRNEAGNEFGDFKKDLFKDAMQRTWTGMVANIAPDGTLIRPPSEFKNAIKAEVQQGVAQIVTAARFAPDTAFLNAFDLEQALGVQGVTDRTRLYIGSCGSKAHLVEDLGSNKTAFGVSSVSDIQSIFCGADQYALLATVEIGDSSPWPVPMGHALFGSSLASAKWKPFGGGDDGNFYILTNEGLELYDGQYDMEDPNAVRPFRPRTANPDKPTITSKYEGKCFTVEASGYGEKYCFDPVKMEGKKVSQLDPNCKTGYGGDCSIASSNDDKTFPAGAMGFNVTHSFMHDTYKFYPQGGGDTQSSGASGDKPSFTSISKAITMAREASQSVEICDELITGKFTYFFKFIEGDKIKLTGISGPKSNSCAPYPETGELTPDVEITQSQTFCSLKDTLTSSATRERNSLDALCATGKSLSGINIGPEEITYKIVTPNSSEKAKDIEVFRTGMFGITRLVTKNFREQNGDALGTDFSPTGFAATVMNGDVAIGVYWAKDAPVFKLPFLDGEEKVFNHLAGKTILEAFGAPNFEAANFQQVQVQ
jgi:hypothetical protein